MAQTLQECNTMPKCRPAHSNPLAGHGRNS